MVVDMEDDEVVQGVDSFNEQERIFTEAVVGMATEIRDRCPTADKALAAMITLTTAVLDKRKSDPEIVTDRVYAFCMTWIAGAISFNRDSSWRLKAVISFLAGAATVVVFNRFMV